MSDINIGQITEALNDKSDRDLRNVDTTAKADAVIDFQLPTADNGYTWYRLYASGWVEQGGVASGASDYSIPLPIQMADTNYTAQATIVGTSNSKSIAILQSSTTVLRVQTWWSTTLTASAITWQVSGLSAN